LLVFVQKERHFEILAFSVESRHNFRLSAEGIMGALIVAAILNLSPIQAVAADQNACAPAMLINPVFIRGDRAIRALEDRALACSGERRPKTEPMRLKGAAEL
jgi:hypothetical protein